MEIGLSQNMFEGIKNMIAYMLVCEILRLRLKLKKKLYGLFLWMGFKDLKARATSRRQFTFYH